METKEGIIKRVKSDRKAISIEGIWYNSVKGDFKNIKSIEQIETKELPQEIEDLNNLTGTDKNCILIVAKDLYLANRDRSFQEYIREIKLIREKL